MHKSHKLESGESDKGDLVFFFFCYVGNQLNWLYWQCPSINLGELKKRLLDCFSLVNTSEF